MRYKLLAAAALAAVAMAGHANAQEEIQIAQCAQPLGSLAIYDYATGLDAMQMDSPAEFLEQVARNTGCFTDIQVFPWRSGTNMSKYSRGSVPTDAADYGLIAGPAPDGKNDQQRANDFAKSLMRKGMFNGVMPGLTYHDDQTHALLRFAGKQLPERSFQAEAKTKTRVSYAFTKKEDYSLSVAQTAYAKAFAALVASLAGQQQQSASLQ